MVWSQKSFFHIFQPPGLERLGLLEMFLQLFDPRAEEHQEDTFCFPTPSSTPCTYSLTYHIWYSVPRVLRDPQPTRLWTGPSTLLRESIPVHWRQKLGDSARVSSPQAVFVLISQRMSNSIFIVDLRTHIYTRTEITLTSWKQIVGLLLFRRSVLSFSCVFFLEATVDVSPHCLCIWQIKSECENEFNKKIYICLTAIWENVQSKMRPFASVLLANPDLLQMTHWLFNNVTWCELYCVVTICPAVALCSNKIVDNRRKRIVPQADFFLPSRLSWINSAFREIQ